MYIISIKLVPDINFGRDIYILHTYQILTSMLLDYKYIKKQRKLSVSYVNDQGMKSILDFNVDKFKTYYSTPTGQYENWDGSRCGIKWTDDPSKFDIRTFFEEMDPKYKKMISGKTSPRLYTFDIETQLREDREFTEPSVADMPVHTISIVSPELKTIVLGVKEMNQEGKDWVTQQFEQYLNSTDFFHTLNLPMPTIQYIQFTTEKEMLEYFLKCIVAKVPILSGWNCLGYDWQYITSRIRNYYPSLSITLSSPVFQVVNKNFTDFKGNKYSMPMPLHTPIIDMMDVMGFDMAVMPIKESLGLDYIASETPGLGIHKIEYDGDLELLYERDFSRYVFYNAIDSILVQLINYRYKTLDTMYMQALYCGVKIQDTFSKIAVSEALVWDDFYKHGKKVVYARNEQEERGKLLGAYVVKPIPGKWNFITCNDFSSLYPSTIITCNISFENFIQSYYDHEKLKQYEHNPQYIVIGPVVYTKGGTDTNPELGEYVGTFIDNEALEPYRKDPNYFVSVNGHVYKNDQDYSFKRIQALLKSTRNVSKYLGKQLDAIVMLDVEHILKGRQPSIDPYADNLVEAIQQMGYDVHSSKDLLAMTKEDLKEFQRKLGLEITFYGCKEQAMKLLGNSMYGGSSHIAFYWFNINLARDITGEARNLTKLMESHLPGFWDENWPILTDLHKKIGVEVDVDKAHRLIAEGKHMMVRVYGDTDSLYMSYTHTLETIKGIENMSRREKLDVLVKINTEFLNGHNKQFMDKYYSDRHVHSIHDFELETIALSGLWLNIKKRYCQILLWKDGKFFDDDSLPLKVKGLEMIKSSYPKFDREALKRVVRGILEAEDDKNLWEHTNILIQQEKMKHHQADIEDICASTGVNGYTKYILTKEQASTTRGSQASAIDTAGTVLYTAPKCPANVRALGNYNTIREAHHLEGDPIYGGKCKVYVYRLQGMTEDIPFAFQSKNYPKWAPKYAPINKNAMFKKYFLDPINRICQDSMGFVPFQIDGYRQMTLF